MSRTIFDPITVVASDPAVPIVIPNSIVGLMDARAIVELQVHSCDGIVDIVGAVDQTKGCTIQKVGGSDYNSIAIQADVQGLDLFAYSTVPRTIVFIPVLVPRAR